MLVIMKNEIMASVLDMRDYGDDECVLVELTVIERIITSKL